MSQAPPAEAHAAERERRARATFLVSNAHRFVRLGLGLVAAPLALSHFGKERYGFWIAVGSVSAYLALSHFGIGSSLVNAVARARGRGDGAAIGASVSSAFFPFLAIAAALAAAGGAVAFALPLDAIFGGLPPAAASEARLVLTLAVLTVAADLPLRILLAAQQGYQEEWRASAWGIASALVGFGALVAAALAGGGLVHWALGAWVAAAAANAANAALFVRAHPESAPRPRLVERARLRALLGEGLLFWLLQMCTILILYTDNLVIAGRIGTGDVVAYAAVLQVAHLGIALVHALGAANWGAYAESAARGDRAWLRARVARVTLTSLWLAAPAAVCLYAWGGPLIQLWLRGRVAAPPGVLAALSLLVVVNVWYTGLSVVLNALGRIKEQLLVFGAEGAVHVGLALALAGRFGVEGVAWANVAPAAAISAWMIPLLVRRAIGAVPAPAGAVLRGVAVPAGAALAAALALAGALEGRPPLAQLAAGVPATLAVYAAASLLLLGRDRALLIRR